MDRASIRRAGVAALALTLTLLGVLYALPTRAAPPLAATVNAADIVVQFPDGVAETRRITFTGTISGYAALARSGLPLVTSSNAVGLAVCRIGDVGCASGQDCFCQCAGGGDCRYWEYSRFGANGFTSSNLGASATTVSDGAIEGWSWGRALPPVGRASYAARAGLQWLARSRLPDGSFGGASGTLDAALAQAAAGKQPDDALIAFLQNNAGSYARLGASQTGKLMVGVAAIGMDPRDFAGLDLVISATATLNTATGAYGSSNWDQAFTILGLRAAGEPVPANALAALRARAQTDGGFGYSFEPGGASDIDSTGLVLQALIAAGEPRSSATVVSALTFLDTAQRADGGFPYNPGDTASNVNSTAYALQGLLAAGADPLAARWQPASTNAISYLLSKQTPDGAFLFGTAASPLATAQAVPALLGQPYPLRSPAVVTRRALSYMAAQQRSGGGFADFSGGAPSLGSTVDALLALKAAGKDPQTVRNGGKSGLDFLQTTLPGALSKAATTGRLIQGVVASGANPRDYLGYNLVISLTQRYNPATGAYGSDLYDQAYGMLGLASAGAPVPISATQRLESLALPSGGWDGAGFGVSADDTGLALLAWGAARRQTGGVSLDAVCVQGDEPNSAAVRGGVAYLRRTQNGAAGWGFGAGTSSSSTGLALQGLLAVGQQPSGLGWTTVVTDSAEVSRLTEQRPRPRLLAQQLSDGGFAGFSGGADPRETYQAIPAVVGRLPLLQTPSRVWLGMVRR